jgi:hypothetical protein
MSDNASATEPAVIAATLFVDTEIVDEGRIQALVVIDKEYRGMVKEAQEKSAVGSGGKA